MVVILRKRIIMYDVRTHTVTLLPNESIISHSTQAVDLTLSSHKA